MPNVLVDGKSITLSPAKSKGIGGEAEVFDIGDGYAFKLYKTPQHSDYREPDGSANVIEQNGAKERIKVHQTKLSDLLKLAPMLPPDVITPTALGKDPQGHIVGYAMPLIEDVEPILNMQYRRFHDQGLEQGTVTETFIGLWNIVNGCHEVNFLIGDFNPLNVLVRRDRPFLIDSDSGQFAQYLCKVYTETYVDVLLCDPDKKAPQLVRPYNTDADWYSFMVMLMTSLLCVGPYGGVYFPKGNLPKCGKGARPLKRITVFNDGVIYPKDTLAYPRTILPDDLLQELGARLKSDKRGEFPMSILENLRWTKCTACGVEHARDKCPVCDKVAPAAIKQTEEVRGDVTSIRLFQTKTGTIVYADIQNGKPVWLYHEGGAYKREDGRSVAKGALKPGRRIRLTDHSTMIGSKGKVIELSNSPPEQHDVDNLLNLPVFDVTPEGNFLWLSGGQLMRKGNLVNETIGKTLPNQTLFWSGSHFGFGFYRAGNYNVAFVFNPKSSEFNDSVKTHPIKGQLVDSTCFFSSHYCWFITQTQEGGRLINRCSVITEKGETVATAEVEDGSDSWLSQIRGKCAMGKFLFIATDDGLMRVSVDNGKIVEDKTYPDTKPFVDASCHLFAGKGIYVVDSKEVRLLQMK